jgi:hypothetical protein
VTRPRLGPAALALMALLAPAAPAQVPGNGPEIFAALLHFHGFEAKEVSAFARVPPAERTVIVFGQPPAAGSRDARLTRETLARGGSVLWAVDGTFYLGATLNDGSELAVVDRPDRARVFNGTGDYPLLRPRSLNPATLGMLAAAGKVPDPATLLMAGLNSVVAYRPCYATGRPNAGRSKWEVLADMPGSPPVALTSSQPGGHRALLVAGSGVICNRLLAAEGTDNLAFANNVAVWLGDRGRRNACLFLDNGVPLDRLDRVSLAEPPPATPTPPVPPTPPLPDILDPAVQAKLSTLTAETIKRLQESNTFNRKLVGDPERDSETLEKFLKDAAGVLAALAMALALRRVLAARHAPDAEPPPRGLTRAAPDDVSTRRREELLQHGDTAGMISEYLRHWFAECGATPGRELPAVRFRTGIDGKPVAASLRILWGVAFDPARGPAARRAPYGRWKQLEPLIHAAQAAHAAGDWRFAEPTTKEPA